MSPKIEISNTNISDHTHNNKTNHKKNKSKQG